MNTRDKKFTVLHLLSKENEPIGLPQLLAKLGNGYVERTLRRWLAELVSEGLVNKQGEKRGSKYQAMSKSHKNTLVPSVGIDEVRVRYRQQRRELIRHIILNGIVGKGIIDYVALETSRLVAAEDRKAFVEDVMEDLKEMDFSRLAGLGVTEEQLEYWQKLRN